MSVVALTELARPRTAADRRRWRLMVLACGGTVTLLLTFARVLRLTEVEGRYAAYVEETGLRAGTLSGVLLCCVPLLVLLAQALRVGSAARERRLIAIRVAGASRLQLRSIAVIEGAKAGFAGGLVGTVGYLLLGWVAPRIADVHLRLVPEADPLDLLAVPAVVLSVALLAGLSAMLSASETVVAPRRVSLREPRPLPRSRAILAVILFGLLWVGALEMQTSSWVEAIPFGLILDFVALMFVSAPYLVLVAARWLDRSRDPMRQLAAARLRADPRVPGRIVSVVAVCGATFSMATVYLVGVTQDTYRWGDDAFYVTGGVLAVAGAMLALAVSVLSLIVAASEQILDGRRATAVLAAFGVSVKDLRRALRTQLTSVTVLAASVGAVLGAGVLFWPFARLPGPVDFAGIAIAVLAGTVAAWIPTAFLAPQIAEATSAENLRTA